MYTDQTGKLPHSSTQGSNYQIIIYEIDGASTWVEVMKNRPEGEMIEARRRGLKNETTGHHARTPSPRQQNLPNLQGLDQRVGNVVPFGAAG